MAGFNFEKNLPHQQNGVDAVLKLFDGALSKRVEDKTLANLVNPTLSVEERAYYDNLRWVQEAYGLDDSKYRNLKSNVIDVSMETGTGKTYTYTKMMFEFKKQFDVSKFIVIVPTLSIKAGTLNFLKSDATAEHFRSEYNLGIKTYVVESQKSKSKKSYMPSAVREFVEINTQNSKDIHILIINAGMINSDTMSRVFDVNLIDRFNTPFSALASVQPLTIIDEPHKFGQENKTWQNILKFNSQYIVRYGATFDEKYENLVYRLSAVDAFNQDLVKGVVTYVESFENAQNDVVTLKALNGIEATFELNSDGIKKTVKLIKGGSLEKVHGEMHALFVEHMNKSIVLLSNGLEIRKGDKINPYSYSQSLQDKMMTSAIRRHFEIEKELLSREVKIKPLSLFFIDDIEGYREAGDISGSLKVKFELLVKAHIEKLLKEELTPFYKAYLQKSLKDLSLTHGGYFSKDNSDKDEKIEKEIQEILHDKESLLSLGNVRRFIFSKWTLREGWDNPNVFQICKLRSSGSVTSKLQEVGRGLRLPVNEFMSRVKDESFDLHYYVDFTEEDFAESLVGEINNKSGTINEMDVPTKLEPVMIEKILEKYPLMNEEEMFEVLDANAVVKRNNEFKEGGFETLKGLFPLAFADGLKANKVRRGDKEQKKAALRVGKYDELKSLWETINQKVILEYKIENEEKFFELFKNYLLQSKDEFKPQGIKTTKKRLRFENNVAEVDETQSVHEEILAISTMDYKSFLFELSNAVDMNVSTIHKAFVSVHSEIDINLYKSTGTIRAIKGGFAKYLLDNAVDVFSIGYKQVSNALHPTSFTNDKGELKKEIIASSLGVHYSEKNTADAYLFDELYFDSPLEERNIRANIDEVIVFTKIPKNSIRIPVAGGGTYSPDFAYVIKREDGSKSLNLVVETKDKEKRALYKEEKQKIKHAQELFNSFSGDIKIEFKTQFENKAIEAIIKECI